jgi:DNA-binding NtrC family response regulator
MSACMNSAPIFLVIDFQRESRFLLVKTLIRKFPGATIRECENAEQAVQIARTQDVACIITHRTFETPGADLVRQLREVDPDVPIVMVSGLDREKAAMAAGATSFLSYDEWLRIGTIVEQHVTKREADEDRKPDRDCVA